MTSKNVILKKLLVFNIYIVFIYSIVTFMYWKWTMNISIQSKYY